MPGLAGEAGLSAPSMELKALKVASLESRELRSNLWLHRLGLASPDVMDFLATMRRLTVTKLQA